MSEQLSKMQHATLRCHLTHRSATILTRDYSSVREFLILRLKEIIPKNREILRK